MYVSMSRYRIYHLNADCHPPIITSSYPGVYLPNYLQELNGFELGDKKLVCQRANAQNPRGGDNGLQALLGMSGMGALGAGMINPALLQGLVPGLAGMTGIGAAAAPAFNEPATRVVKVSFFFLFVVVMDG